jgi:hypothetical protein
MTACKHANGRDYWLIMGASVKNIFYKFLITPDSILGPFQQTIGPKFPLPYDIAYSKFSQDGSRYATGIIEGPIVLMDFDRCTGEFSNPTNIYHSASSDPIHHPMNGCASLEFSPGGRYLYINNLNDLTQYDLASSNIQDSVELYVSDTTDIYEIGMLQLAPNGIIYGSTWNGGLEALHIIANPDSGGVGCNFEYGGQPTFTLNSANLPNLINYKLGPLIGSGCDTILNITSQATEAGIFRIQPNPADKYFYAEMSLQGNYDLDLLNTDGQTIKRKQTRQIDIFDTHDLPSGVYFLKVIDKSNNNNELIKRVIVEH